MIGAIESDRDWTVDPDRLRALRDRKHWNQEQLAREAEVAKRTIAALEKRPGPNSARSSTISGLTKALGVSPEVLSGSAPVPDRLSDVRAVPLRANLPAWADVNYELVERRFGVKRQWLLEHAPLLLAVLATDSLRWRNERLAEAEGALAILRDASVLYAGRHANAANFVAALQEERGAVERRDVMSSLGEEWLEDDQPAPPGFERNTHVFGIEGLLAYIRTMAASDVGESLLGDCDFYIAGPGPSRVSAPFLASISELESISGTSFEDGPWEAMDVLLQGDVRIADIPEALREDGREDNRRNHLAQRARSRGELL